MSDDAEFDAFLKGEGDLSRSLQSMPQAGPSAALDAAILARARLAMEQESRPPAANDPGDAAPTPRLAPSFAQRWKIPMGIAASVLAGVFATQSFTVREEPSAAMSTDVVVPAAPVSEPAPVMEAPAAAPQARELATAPSHKPALEPVPERRAELARRTDAGMADKRVASAPPPPPPQQAAVAADMAAKASPQFERYASAPQPVPAPAPAMDREAYAIAPQAAPAPPTVVAVSPAPSGIAASAAVGARAKTELAENTTRVEVTGSSVKRRDGQQWLADIEQLLKEGQTEKARLEWEKFRIQYPRQKVAPELEAKLEALAKP